MKIGIVKKDNKIVKEKSKKPLEIISKTHEIIGDLENSDIIISIGDDRTLLNTFIELEKEIPVLGVECASKSFLTEIKINELVRRLKDISRNNYMVEARKRLEAVSDGEKLPYALNEIGVFPKKSATLLKYSLTIDEQSIYRDTADGVVVATPTGSTGYSLSAGGPIVKWDSRVFIITPICSTQDNKPIIVKDSSNIRIGGLTGPNIEVIIDGQYRAKTKNELKIKESEKSALFVRFSEKNYLDVLSKLKQKTKIPEKLEDAPPTAKFIYKLLDYEGSLTQKQIIQESLLPERTVRHSLNYLLEEGYVRSRTSLRDTRQKVYVIK